MLEIYSCVYITYEAYTFESCNQVNHFTLYVGALYTCMCIVFVCTCVYVSVIYVHVVCVSIDMWYMCVLLMCVMCVLYCILCMCAICVYVRVHVHICLCCIYERAEDRRTLSWSILLYLISGGDFSLNMQLSW